MSIPTAPRPAEPSVAAPACGATAGGPPAPGDLAPDFALHGAPIDRLSGLRGAPVVVTFHHAHWDPAREAYAAAYNALVTDLPGVAGARLLSVGGDGAWRELAFADASVTIPVVAADSAAAAAAYGLGDAPAVFVIDAVGRVRWRHVAADATLPRPDDVRRALAALAEGDGVGGDTPGAAPSAAPGEWTRREFVAAALGAAVALSLVPGSARAAAPAPAPPAVETADGAAPVGAAVPMTLRVNGRDVRLTLEPRVTLLDALREYAGLTGSKKGCDHGQCGSCTVHVDGRRVLSCLSLAVMQQGKAVTTIEGLAATAPGAPGDLHPMQRAFITHDGYQCGYCTPGQVMSACAVLREPWGPGDDDVREAMSGNLCRCGAYPGIVAAVQAVRRATPPTRAEA